MIGPKTIEGLEREFELDTDRLDARLVNNQLTQAEYDELSRERARKFEADVAALPLGGRAW